MRNSDSHCRAIFQQYRLDTMSALNQSKLYSSTARNLGGRNGIFNDACVAHTQGYYGDYYDNTKWEVPENSGMTLAKSLHLWMDEGASGAAAIHVDKNPWPANGNCHTAGSAAAGSAASVYEYAAVAN